MIKLLPLLNFVSTGEDTCWKYWQREVLINQRHSNPKNIIRDGNRAKLYADYTVGTDDTVYTIDMVYTIRLLILFTILTLSTLFVILKLLYTAKTLASMLIYESIATVGESRVCWRADFQSGSRVLKKVFWTFSYLYLWHTMWFHAKKLLKTLKFWKSLNSLCKSGSRPQNPKTPKPRKVRIHCKILQR